MLTDANRKASIIAYYLSKYNKDALRALGYDTYSSAFESISKRFGKSNNYMKLRRDEFDVFMDGGRKGWRNREPAPIVTRMHQDLKNFSFEDLTFIVKALIADSDAPFVRPSVTESDRRLITDFSEVEIERIMDQQDPDATIRRHEAMVKTRIMNTQILKSLKSLYKYRCQICGATATIMYGVDVSEAHHIDYFTHSLNNSPKNVVILCPDHHRIVHKTEAVFNFELLEFEYENAKTDTLMFNLHL